MITASPLNYIGGKAKLLPQLLPLFPSNIATFHDVFAGGGNVGVNVECDEAVLNDNNRFVTEILSIFCMCRPEEIVKEIDAYIAKFSLSKYNERGFIECREFYNKNKNPLLLYALVCHSFNYQLRFNSRHEYNNPFGRNRSWFSPKLREKLCAFVEKMNSKTISISNLDFSKYFERAKFGTDDLVYCDPPYLITTGSYNDGKRGFDGWNETHERKLHNCLDELNKRGVKFALSNVVEHKGQSNTLLQDWSRKYVISEINKTYSNSSHNTQRLPSREVLITNYGAVV